MENGDVNMIVGACSREVVLRHEVGDIVEVRHLALRGHFREGHLTRKYDI